METNAKGLPQLKTFIEGALIGSSTGQRSLLVWAGATRKAVCHIKASIVGPKGQEVASVEDVVRVLDDRDTDTQLLVPLSDEVDVFNSSVKIESHCAGRYWW